MVGAEVLRVELGLALGLPQAVVVGAQEQPARVAAMAVVPGLALEQASELLGLVPPPVAQEPQPAAWVVAPVSDSGCRTRSHGGAKRQPHLSTFG